MTPTTSAQDRVRPDTTGADQCAVAVGGSTCGESQATHENGTLYVHAFSADGVDRPNPNPSLIEVGHHDDDFVTGF